MNSFKLVAVSLVVLIAITVVHAKKRDNPSGGSGDSAASYTLADLGGANDGGLIQSEAFDLNNPNSKGRMQIAGFSFVDGDEHAALWDVESGGSVRALTDISPPATVDTVSRQVNDYGQAVVGDFVWIPEKGLTILPGFEGGIGFAGVMNDVGDIVGWAVDAGGNGSAAIWHLDQEGNIDGPYGFDLGSEAFFVRDLNNMGVMAGGVHTANGDRAAIAMVDDFGVLQVFELGLLTAGDTASEATAINNLCEVVGESHSPASGGSVPVAFLWKPGGEMIGLGDLGGGKSRAFDINDSTQIVGEAYSSSGSQHQRAFLWQDGVMRDLNQITDMGGGRKHLQRASAINNVGYIVGLLQLGKPVSESHAFLLIPTATP